jgi:hypothetical protein
MYHPTDSDFFTGEPTADKLHLEMIAGILN